MLPSLHEMVTANWTVYCRARIARSQEKVLWEADSRTREKGKALIAQSWQRCARTAWEVSQESIFPLAVMGQAHIGHMALSHGVLQGQALLIQQL